MEERYQAAAKFLAHLHAGRPIRHCFQLIWPHPGADKRPSWKYEQLSIAFPALLKKNQEGYNIYFLVNQGSGEGRTQKDIEGVTAFFVDLDGSPLDPVLSCPIPPHLVTETSEGRYQAFWRVSSCPLDRFSPIQRALARKFDSDPQVVDLPRVMRLPGFVNNKREPPFLVKTKMMIDAPLVSWTEFITEMELDISSPQPQPEEHRPESGEIPQGSRHSLLAKTTYRLRREGIDWPILVDTVHKVNSSQCKPPLPREEVDQILASAKRNVVLVPTKYEERGNPSLTPARIYSAKELKTVPIPQTLWIVEGLLPAGLTVLAGPPKVGKSWLAYAIWLNVALSTHFLGHPVKSPGTSLYLALEDPVWRGRTRMERLLNGSIPDCAYWCNSWPRTGKGGLEFLEDWVSKNSSVRLIIVDTLAKFRPPPSKTWGSVYERDYADVSMLQRFAVERNIAVIAITHYRKEESEESVNRVTGSIGITGAPDTIWMLSRKRETETGLLQVTGRDIAERVLRLRFNAGRCRWELG